MNHALSARFKSIRPTICFVFKRDLCEVYSSGACARARVCMRLCHELSHRNNSKTVRDRHSDSMENRLKRRPYTVLAAENFTV